MSRTVIVSGTFRILSDAIEAWRPHAIAMLEAPRAEPGCRVYSYAHDAGDAALIRVYEEWESGDALAHHFETPHMRVCREVLAELGAFERDIRRFEAGEGEPV
ncbi:putative quinol monooxygenase [Breoghania sp.]|uniref:putative quinol monooxygenase n=1 Tax=Breoghania sp. TaxID=2065378 RepID=UPI00260396FB|nr:putative quinol monooxygenase [Breoghania sp.]MDJ0931673.1 putative quinol monooxygenase [Breoghania sp.]